MRKSDPLPSSEFEPHDRRWLSDYLKCEQDREAKTAELRARSLGRRVFRSFALRDEIRRARVRQHTLQSMHPELITPENLASYSAWLEAIADHLEAKKLRGDPYDDREY